MSFGWSAGDIVAAINLVNRIVKCMGHVGGAREHFQELESELLSLSRALHEISVLTNEPGQIPEIVALKFVACLCEETLKRFYEKIKPFDNTLGVRFESSVWKGKSVPRMVRWELLIRKDIPELRSYLVAHVGSLTLRLNTALLKITSRSLANVTQSSIVLKGELQNEANSICEKIGQISQGYVLCPPTLNEGSLWTRDTIPRLDDLLTVATEVWTTQKDMIDKLSKISLSLPSPDTRHTWAQAPVRFEDALGRIIPVPSEYDWDKIEAVIQAQFKRGPGHAKVRSGEYELYDGRLADIAIIKEHNFCPIPGMTIIMAFVLGQYAGSENCPRLGCKSQSFKKLGSSIDGRVCSQCQSWFRSSKYALPKPLKPLTISDGSSEFGFTGSKLLQPPFSADDVRRERRRYKNLSIYVTELPPTPKVFRDKYHRTREPPPPRTARKPQYIPSAWIPGRPQTTQMSDIQHYQVSNRPQTIDFMDTENAASIQARGKAPSRYHPFWPSSVATFDVHALQWKADMDEYEMTLEEMAAATLDEDFKDELCAIEQWFRVLSETERAAALYALLQQTMQVQIRFFIPVLQQMKGLSNV